jgi:hypothetical protein
MATIDPIKNSYFCKESPMRIVRRRERTCTIESRKSKEIATENKYVMVACQFTAADRFIVIDGNTVYHFGASLKDLGKKWLAFSKMDIGAVEMLGKLEKMI